MARHGTARDGDGLQACSQFMSGFVAGVMFRHMCGGCVSNGLKLLQVLCMIAVGRRDCAALLEECFLEERSV